MGTAGGSRPICRCAVILSEPKLYCTASGKPVLFQCWRYVKIGFTPLRIGTMTKHSQGEPDDLTRSVFRKKKPVSFKDSQVTFRGRLPFRLSWFVNILGMAETSHSAPYAILDIELEIGSSHLGQLNVSSSAVPSLHVYRNWLQAATYDMLTCSQADFEDFLAAGHKAHAAKFERFQIRLDVDRRPVRPGELGDNPGGY